MDQEVLTQLRGVPLPKNRRTAGIHFYRIRLSPGRVTPPANIARWYRERGANRVVMVNLDEVFQTIPRKV